jgi:hypothetical protein
VVFGITNAIIASEVASGKLSTDENFALIAQEPTGLAITQPTKS